MHNELPSQASKCEAQTIQCPIFTKVILPNAPAHFYVLCGLLLECPHEPQSKWVVIATASRVAVLSIQGAVGVPLRGFAGQ